MSGPFGDPSDANRKPRGPRPFAGQVHPPGSGPLKGSRVRRPTLAPFPSPFVEQEPEARAAVQAPLPAPAPEIDTENQPPIDSDLLATFRPEPAAPAVESTFAALAEAPTEEIPYAPFAHVEPEDAQFRADAEDAPLTPGIEAPTISNDDVEAQEDFYAEAFGEPELHEIRSDPFAEVEAEPSIDPLYSQNRDEEEPFSPAAESDFGWSATDDLESRPESALHTDELRERDIEGDETVQEPGVSAGAADAEDDWFSEAPYSSRNGDLDEAPFDRIESVGNTPRSLAAEGSADVVPELPPVSLPVDWAVSPDGEADLQSYVAEVRIREEASEVLEGVARRVRSGEIVLALEPGASPEAVLASVLASLLT